MKSTYALLLVLMLQRNATMAQAQAPPSHLQVIPGIQTGFVSSGSYQILEARLGLARRQGRTQFGAAASLGFYRLFDKTFPRNGDGVKYEGSGSDRLLVSPTATGLGVAFHIRQALTPRLWLQGQGSLRADRIHNRIPSAGRAPSFNFFNGGGGGSAYTWDSYWAVGRGLAATLGYQVVHTPQFALSPYLGISRTWVNRYMPFTTSVIGLQAEYALP